MWSRSPVRPVQVTGLTLVSAPTCTGTGWTSCICCWCLYWKSYEIIKGVTAKLLCCRTFFFFSFNLLHRQVWWSCLGKLLMLGERCAKWFSIATVTSRRSSLPSDFLLNLKCTVVSVPVLHACGSVFCHGAWYAVLMILFRLSGTVCVCVCLQSAEYYCKFGGWRKIEAQRKMVLPREPSLISYSTSLCHV